MPLGSHAMETVVSTVVLFVEYRQEHGGEVGAEGVTDRDPDRQTSTGFFSLPGVQGSWRWRFKGSARMTSVIRTKAEASLPQVQLKPS